MRWLLYVVFALSFIVSGCSSTPSWPPSDHYNGEKFFNPDGAGVKGFFALLKWQLTSEKAEWPERIELPPALPLEPVTDEKAISITFINHSTFLIRTKNYNILTDPIWSDRASPVKWAGPKRVHSPPLDFNSLPPIHFVLVSHNHYDHMDAETLKRLEQKHNPRILVPLGDKKVTNGFGVKTSEELDWGQQIKINEDLLFIFTPAHHWSARGLFDRNESLWGSYIIVYKGQKIYFAGDTGYSPHFEKIRKQYGPMDLSLLPIGAYEPRWFMKEHHMNPAEAVRAHFDLESKKTIGMHYGTFQLTDEKRDQPIIDLKIAKEEKNVPEQSFLAITPGTTIQIL